MNGSHEYEVYELIRSNDNSHYLSELFQGLNIRDHSSMYKRGRKEDNEEYEV